MDDESYCAACDEILDEHLPYWTLVAAAVAEILAALAADPRAPCARGDGGHMSDLLGERVTLTNASGRHPESVGTVIAPDPYPQRDALVLVRCEDGVDRWRGWRGLRTLGHRMSPDDLAASLALDPPRPNEEAT